MSDPGLDDADGTVEVRRIQPYQATKDYACPGCNQTIPSGKGHVVVVPVGDAEGRRHWHSSCWERRQTRKPRNGR
jgi:hypothetical protein